MGVTALHTLTPTGVHGRAPVGGVGNTRVVYGRNRMSEPDERRIAELAEEPPRVLRGGASAKALKEARKVLEIQARQEADGTPPDE